MKFAPSLPGKAIPLITPLAVIALLLTGLIIIFQGERHYRQGQQSALHVQAEILAASVTAAVDFGDQAAAQEAAEALSLNPQVDMAGIYDKHGGLFAGYARAAVLPQRLPQAEAADGAPSRATVPIMRRGTRIGSVHLVGTFDSLARRLSRYAIIALLAAMTLLVLAVLWYGQFALRRVNRTLAGANQALQLEIEERARAEEQLREAQKMQAMGQLTGGVAHDFNNLLAVVQGSAEMLLRPHLPEDKRLRFTHAIIEAATRGALLTGQLLAFARRQPLKPEILDVNDRITRMTEMARTTLGPNIRLDIRLERELPAVEVDPGQLEAAILNIIVNARDAMPDGGAITIRTRATKGQAAHETGNVIVSIEDSGCGIEAERLGRVFEPFYTTKVVGKGTGLGLSQVYGFAAQSGGEARIESEVGEGTVVTLKLPASDKPAPRGSPAAKPVSAAGPGGRILLVEDNETVGNLAETLLGELGHKVVRARSGQEALSLSDKGAEYDVVFSDVVMPGMSGVELAGVLKERRPQLPIILTTGYNEGFAAAGTQGFPIVRKPYRMETLATALEEALAVQRGH